MKVEQIATLVNDLYKLSTGRDEVLNEDYSNLVDMGRDVLDDGSTDKYCGSLVDKVGKMVFVDRPYTGFGYSLLRDGWEFGAILQKVDTETPEAEVNESWTLVNGASYDPNVFRAPKVHTKYFSKRVTFEVDRSITNRQLKSAFNSMGEMNAFITMIFNAIDKAFTEALDNLARGLVNTAIAQTLYAETGTRDSQTSAYGGNSYVKAVNLIQEYYESTGVAITNPHKALANTDFLKFASKRIKETSDRLKNMSALFNIGGRDRFTSKAKQKIILHSELANACDTYLQSDTFHNEFTKLPEAEITTYWQGTGKKYGYADTTCIKTPVDGEEAVYTGIVGVIFDDEALCVCNEDKRTTTQYNAKGEFTNYFYKMDSEYILDLNENIVVFYLASYIG